MKKFKIIAGIAVCLTLLIGLASCDSGADTPIESDKQSTISTDSQGNVVYDTSEPSSPQDTSPEQSPAVSVNYQIIRLEGSNEGMVAFYGKVIAEDGTEQYGYGYMNSKGEVVAPPIYEKVAWFYKGLAAVVKSPTQKGYIDTTGKEVIPCIYSSVTNYLDTLAWVTTAEGVEQMINAKGEVVYTATGKEVAKGYYQNGFFWIETKEEKISGNVHTMTYYNEKGEVAFVLENAKHVEDSEYVDAEELGNSNFDENGYAIVSLQKTLERYERTVFVNWLITTEGKAVELTFEDDNIEPEKASVYNHVGNWYVFMDIISQDIYDYYIDWETKTAVVNNDISYNTTLSTLGNEFYSVAGSSAYKFSGIKKIVYQYGKNDSDTLSLGSIEALGGASVAAVQHQKVNGKDAFVLGLQSSSGVYFVAVIDFAGNVLVEPVKAKIVAPYYTPGLINFLSRFDISPVCAGLILAQDQDTELYGFIDLSGNWVAPAKYENAENFSGDGDNAIAVVNGNTIINRKGEVVFSIANNE